MTLGCNLTQSLALAPKQVLRQSFGEKSGDIPLYSLHRINNLLKKQPPQIDRQLQVLLIQNLLEANQDYKSDSGNDWNCLTSQNLVDALEATDQQIENMIDGIQDIPKELARMRDLLLAKLHEGRAENVRLMKQWFETNFDALHYDMSGKIPWAVVLRLRRGLGQWITTACNPFDQPIEEMVLEVAEEAGISATDPEEAWKKMGGTIFGKKRKD